MSESVDLTILAVTKMHGGVCTAGINPAGNWVRPIRPANERPRYAQVITDYCLLPIDFFHEGHSHLINLGVTRFWLGDAAPQPPHTEDRLLDLAKKPRLIRKLSPKEQGAFLARHSEADLSALRLNGGGTRSLGLFCVERFAFTFRRNVSGDDVAVRAAFRVGDDEVGDIGCTDLRLRVLGRRLLEQSGGEPRTLTEKDFGQRGKEVIYLAVGLSRLYQGRHWLILVGVHSLPELQIEVDYARL